MNARMVKTTAPMMRYASTPKVVLNAVVKKDLKVMDNSVSILTSVPTKKIMNVTRMPLVSINQDHMTADVILDSMVTVLNAEM